MKGKIIDTLELKQIIVNEFFENVSEILEPFTNELRIILKDESFIDVWFSISLANRYSYHWERKHLDSLIFRHDNAPHLKWKNISTFPKHFHNQTEENVEESHISDNPDKAIREIMSFVNDFLKKKF